MKAEQFRMLSGVLALRQFTTAELAEATGVNANTVGSALRRVSGVGQFVVDTGEVQKGSQGRPQKVWSLRPEAVDRARALFDDISGPTVTGGATAEAAEAAFGDRNIQLMVRRHFLLASRADSDEERAEQLGHARDWLEHERERLADWTREGFNIPQEVASEIEKLDLWFEGFELNVDRLAFSEHWDLKRMTSWMTAGMTAWFAEETGRGEIAFRPLAIAPPADGRINESLVKQLLIILNTADQIARFPVDRFVGALLMTLPRLRDQNARDVVCETLKKFGFSQVGMQLANLTNSAHDDHDTRNFILHVLEALNNYPQMLQDFAVGAWFDGLLLSRLWNTHYLYSYIRALEHRPNADIMLALSEKAEELQRQLDLLETRDETWSSETEGLGLEPKTISSVIKRWLGHADRWQHNVDSNFASGWSQRFCDAA